MSFLKKIIAAPPQMVDWTGYKSREMNEKMYGKIFKDKRKKLVEKLSDDIVLYALPDKFVAIDLKKERLLYLVQYVKKRIFGKEGITQIQVWRDKTAPETKGLAEKIFFELLFPMADCIVTDRQQTSYGRAFWELRIYEAFGKGLPVYLLDQNEHTQKRLSTSEEFDQLGDTWWGEHKKYQGRKIAICHKPFWD